MAGQELTKITLKNHTVSWSDFSEIKSVHMIKRLLIIQSIVIVLLVFLLTIYARDEFHDQGQDQDLLKNESFVLNGNKLSLSEATQKLIGLKVQKINSTVYAFNLEFPGMIMPVTELIEAQRDSKILDLAISETSSRLNQKNKIFPGY